MYVYMHMYMYTYLYMYMYVYMYMYMYTYSYTYMYVYMYMSPSLFVIIRWAGGTGPKCPPAAPRSAPCQLSFCQCGSFRRKGPPPWTSLDQPSLGSDTHEYTVQPFFNTHEVPVSSFEN